MVTTKLTYRNLSATSLLFFAGIAASAGTTFITSIPALHESLGRACYLIIASIPWFLISWHLVKFGTRVEQVRRNADLKISELLTSEEIEDIEVKEYEKLRFEFRRFIIFFALAFFSAFIALIPFF